MEIKVIHTCGTKFVFEVEPDNGAMPFAIQCPNCGADATADANAVIGQALATSAPAAASALPPPPPPSPMPGLALGRSHAPAATYATPPPPPPAAPAPAATTIKPAKKAGSSFASDEPHLPLAITGAAVGAAIGVAIWYGMIHYLHFTSGWVAWGTGVLAGFGARTLGRAPTPLFGIIAAAFTLLAILGGAYLGVAADIDSHITKRTEGTYDRAVTFAKQVTQAKDDDALRAVLTEDRRGKGEVTDADLAKLKAEMPRLKELAAGKPGKVEFDQKLRAKVRETVDMGKVIKSSFSVIFIVCIGFGLASAFKIGSGMGS